MTGEDAAWPAEWSAARAGLAGYRIESLIGAGESGTVFRAYHLGMGREVALKVLAVGLMGDEAFKRRFVRSARLLAGVEHPHIIPIYDAGQERGVPYIAMRLVRGGDLQAMVTRDGGMPSVRAAGFVSAVASALDAAHEVGLVHRDLKPANLLVDVGPKRPDHVYLTDFGLARGLDSGGLTESGTFIGAPEYASPEQITGGEVDGRADQYALACVAYTLLTGSTPYPREQQIAVMYAQLYDPPPLVTVLRSDLPDAVNSVIARAMEKRADDRYESCVAFADALRDALGVRLVSSDSEPGPHLASVTPLRSERMAVRPSPLNEHYVGYGDAAQVDALRILSPPESDPPSGDDDNADRRWLFEAFADGLGKVFDIFGVVKRTRAMGGAADALADDARWLCMALGLMPHDSGDTEGA